MINSLDSSREQVWYSCTIIIIIIIEHGVLNMGFNTRRKWQLLLQVHIPLLMLHRHRPLPSPHPLPPNMIINPLPHLPMESHTLRARIMSDTTRWVLTTRSCLLMENHLMENYRITSCKGVWCGMKPRPKISSYNYILYVFRFLSKKGMLSSDNNSQEIVEGNQSLVEQKR